MKPVFIVLLVLCAFSAAMVPMVRQSPEDENTKVNTEGTTTTAIKEFCAPKTPCAWGIYETNAKVIKQNIPNNYCNCSSNLVCKITEDDTVAKAFIYRCRTMDDHSFDGHDR